MSSLDLSVIVPAFNEEARLEGSLRGLLEYFAHRRMTFEVLVVDDGSTDDTAEVARRCIEWTEAGGRIRLLHFPKNCGKGFGVRQGMLVARGDLALMTDADLSTPVTEFEKLQQCLRDVPCDLVIGSRDVAGARVEIHQPWHREFLGKGFNRFVRALTGLPYRDTQCGFKLFQMKRCRAIFEKQRIHGFFFDVELLFIARKWRFAVREVPVTWRHAEGSKVRVLAHGPSIVFDLARLHLNNARGLYGRNCPPPPRQGP